MAECKNIRCHISSTFFFYKSVWWFKWICLLNRMQTHHYYETLTYTLTFVRRQRSWKGPQERPCLSVRTSVRPFIRSLHFYKLTRDSHQTTRGMDFMLLYLGERVMSFQMAVNSSLPGQNRCHYNIFKCIVLDEISVLRLEFHWNLFLRVQLTINQHWFR